MKSNDLEPGDLVFMEPECGDPISGMIVEYDRSRFSHVGIVADHPGHVISSHLAPIAGDLSGVRCEPFSAFDRRPLWGARVTGRTAVEKSAAVKLARTFVENEGSPRRAPEQRSAFSFIKLFIVAAALDAKSVTDPLPREASYLIFNSAREAALNWNATAGRTPAFFCAELVARAYGLDYLTGDFDPPMDAPDLGPVELPSRSQLSTTYLQYAVAGLAAIAALIHELPDGKGRRALRQLVLNLRNYDRAFLSEAARTIAKEVRFKTTRPDREEIGAAGPAAPLPAGLVTPRMVSVTKTLIDAPEPLVDHPGTKCRVDG